jgi:phosphomannomutase
VHLGGATSVDVTRRASTKPTEFANSVTSSNPDRRDDLYRGCVFPGGNDYPAKEAGALSIAIRDPHETKRVIEAIVACLG